MMIKVENMEVSTNMTFRKTTEEFSTRLEDSKGTQGKPATIKITSEHMGFFK